MGSSSFQIFELPGTNIDIIDGLEACGLGVVCVSSPGSADIPLFEEKFILFQPDTKHEASRLNLRAVSVPKDAKLLYAATMFEATQKDDENFVREGISLHLLFESDRLGDLPVSILLTTLGKFPDIKAGWFFCTQRSFTSH